MTWVWRQSKGTISHSGIVHGHGYSGNGLGKNNPAAQDEHGVGPAPRGLWTIGEPHVSPNTGAYTMDLTPAPGTDTEGRTALKIHGDSINHPGEASHGCIILSRQMREAIWKCGDHQLEVKA